MKVTLPQNSVLYNTSYDYTDSYKSEFFDIENRIQSNDIGKAFLTSAPKWTSFLFRLRNNIVAVFGLKTSGKASNRKELIDNFKCEPDERLGLFKVYRRTEDEVILGEDDKHLNFRISLLKDTIQTKEGLKTLTISTTVQYNNWFGKLYFFPVKPFHKLIAPKMLHETIKQLSYQYR